MLPAHFSVPAATLLVRDALGRVVMSVAAIGSGIAFDLSGLAPAYIITSCGGRLALE